MRPSVRAGWVALCIPSALGCPGRGVDLDGGAATDAPSSDSNVGTGASADVDASADGTGNQPTSCGDGIVDSDEDCDDGNEIDGDGCNRDCVVSGSELWRAETGTTGCNDITIDAAGSICFQTHEPTAVSCFDGADGTLAWSVGYDELPDAFLGPLGRRTGPGVFVWQGFSDGALRLQQREDDAQVSWDETFALGPTDEYFTFSAALDTEDGFAAAIIVGLGGSPETRRLDLIRVSVNGELELLETAATGIHEYDATAVAPDGSIALGGNHSVASYAADASLRWAVDLPASEDATDVAVTPDGRVHATVTIALPSAPSRTVVRTFTSQGALANEWEHGPGDVPSAAGVLLSQLEVDPSGNLVVAALVYEPTEHIHVAKYTADGNLSWQRSLAAERPLSFCGLAVDPDGATVLGMKWPYPDPSTRSGYRSDHTLVRLAP